MIQPELFERDRVPASKLPTNLTAGLHPIHRWFSITAGFSPEFVSRCLNSAKAEKLGPVVDPFSGLATTLVQANFEGVPSIGTEAHPFFYDLSLAKIHPPNSVGPVRDLLDLLASVEPYGGRLEEVWGDKAVEFLLKLVPEAGLRHGAAAMLLEPEIEEELRPLFRLVTSRVLEAMSGSQTDGIYKAPTTRKRAISYLAALESVGSIVLSDVGQFGEGYQRLATVTRGTAEDLSTISDSTCGMCITSPPYLNNFDFAEMTRMELYFWRYASSWGEITERVRRNLIVNTTTAPTDLKRSQERFRSSISPAARAQIDPIVERLAVQRSIRAGKKDYDLLVYPYFAQMKRVIEELRRVLKPGAPLHLVVADAALYGVHIHSEQILADQMRESGFENVDVIRLRDRGHRWILEKRQGSPMPLGEFHINAR